MLSIACQLLSLPCIAAAELAPIPLGDRQMEIHAEGLRFSLLDQQGSTLAPAHHVAGASLNGSALSVISTIDQHSFQLVSKKGERAKLIIKHDMGCTAVTISPDQPATPNKPHKIALQLGGMPVAYGLGDTGGWNQTLNLVNDEETTYSLKHDGGKYRWLSSFVIFPRNNFASVTFDGLNRSITLSKSRFKTTVTGAGAATFYYFTGSMKDIYASYQKLLVQKGYPLIKPKSRLFELGWESWAALGWQTNAKTMLDSITKFQERGFPIRWAVSGSGFWEDRGTTTSFGKWGKKFPGAMDFKEQLHQRDVKWMIGLRTNFVPPGGPYKPVTKERDQNMVVDTFSGNPLSQAALDRNYFLKKPDGQLWKRHSNCFPIVPCYLIDGNNAKASKWYAELYQQWQVDGIKEDTMMGLGSTHTDVFNHPIANIADDGALVMARCGSFTSPGTLLRINDTHVNELSRRIPINYLQNAACGAPNAYSDTVGFKKMKNYSELVVRHAWLLSLTAGLAVGESSSHWTEKQQTIFKKPFDFHYRIVPTLYDAAMKSYLSGYPHTMTPLGIAYPGDARATAAPNFQWMIGDSLLCAPLLKNHSSGKMNLYLPEGIWFDYDTGDKHTGPKLLKDFPMPVTKTPCFIGGKGILVTRASDSSSLTVHLYPAGKNPKSHTVHHPDGTSTSKIVWVENSNNTQVTDTTTGKTITSHIDENTAALSFSILPEHHYLVQ
ncbi:MAG: glycoside hydrolase family 31 protein [Akkermansiaceae bacterium]|nr:glycoside hydrolase family 31 protein [Akkermansiaceae bacterium]